jgi:predicted lipid-binding transport protein (Tim44 family)
MKSLSRLITPVLVVLFGLFILGGGPLSDTVDAKARFGGKSFRSSPYKAPVSKTAPRTQKSGSSFGRGLAGGLLGGALGGMLFGSMFGGEGMGILPLLLLGGVGYFLFRKFKQTQTQGYQQHGGSGFPGQQGSGPGQFGQSTPGAGAGFDAPPPAPGSPMAVESGLAEIRRNDPGFDPDYFLEVASDVFFQVQAGWMRREIDSFKHLLGDQLAQEYAGHFADMKARGVINKLESIAVRKVAIDAAGNTGTEDFVTVLFTANLLDYTVDDKTGDVVEGSMTDPIKFEEKWTWARPLGTENWRLEGIHGSD